MRKFQVREEAQDTLFFGTMELSDLLVQEQRQGWPDQLLQCLREIPARVNTIATLDRGALMAVAAFRGKNLITYASSQSFAEEQLAWCGAQPYSEAKLSSMVAELNGLELPAEELALHVSDAYMSERINERERALLLTAIEYARLTIGAAAGDLRPLYLSCPAAAFKTEGNECRNLCQRGAETLSCDLLYLDSDGAFLPQVACEFLRQADARYLWYAVADGDAAEPELLAVMEERGELKMFPHKGFALYFVECENRDALAVSPLGGRGAPAKMLQQILPQLPNRITTFVDLFCGEGNVGANVLAEKIIFSDADALSVGLLKLLRTCPRAQIFAQVQRIIKQYGLSESEKFGFEHYGCNSSEGLGSCNKNSYIKLRGHFNQTPDEERGVAYWCELLTLLAYASGSQARKNAAGKFNLPVGKRDFNSALRRRLTSFQQALKQRSCSFATRDFREFEIELLPAESLVYAEPPSLLGAESAYEAPRTWKENDERDLCRYLDRVHKAGLRFALVDTLAHRVIRNEVLINWLKAHASDYRMTELVTDDGSPYKVVLIKNY